MRVTVLFGLDQRPNLRVHGRPSQARQINAPDVLLSQIGQPHRAESYTDGIAARAGPLASHLIGGGIDFGKRDLEDSNPNVTLAESDLAPGSGDADLDGRDHLAGFSIHTGDRAIALVESPE